LFRGWKWLKTGDDTPPTPLFEASAAHNLGEDNDTNKFTNLINEE